MAEILLELFLGFLAFLGFRKRRKKREDGSRDTPCAGCGRNLQNQIIYEKGQTWCKACYKSDVLRISL